MTRPAKVLAAGTLLGGRFEIGEVLGIGGMAVVYEARQRTMFNRPVAVKVLDLDLAADETYRRRFEREAGLVSVLNHPHIIAVHDYGEADGRLYIAMQRVEGQTLAERIRSRPASGSEVVAALRPIAAALDYAHETGLLHRDIKPENILLEERGGNVLLADFGIARGLDGTVQTATGSMLGTLRYASPEQLTERHVGPATDVYSLAVVAYEALTGAPGPYVASSEVRYLQAHLDAYPLPLLPADEPAAAAVHEALCWGLAKRPEDRPDTATELVNAIANALGDASERRPAFTQDRPSAAPADLDGWFEQLDTGQATEEPGTDTAELPLADTEPLGTGELAALLAGGLEISEEESPPRPPPAADRRRRAVVGWWPLAVAGASLVLPAANVLGRETPPALRTLNVGPARIQVAAAAVRPSTPKIVVAAGLPGVQLGRSVAAAGTPEAGIAVTVVDRSHGPLAPPSAKSSTLVRVVGGTARRYETRAGTVFVAQTPRQVVWLGCPQRAGEECAATAASLSVAAQRLVGDPQPDLADAVRGALTYSDHRRRDLPLPARDLSKRRSRATLVAEAYRSAADDLQRFAATRPRDGELRELTDDLGSVATAFTDLADAARHQSTTSDRKARQRLRAADAALRGTLATFATRGYRVRAAGS